MAITFRAAGSVTPASGSSCIVPVPAGTVAGDFMVMFAHMGGSGGATITTPTGWTLLDTSTAPSTFYGETTASYYRVASSEPASYTVSFSASARCTAAIVGYTGSSTTPRDHQVATDVNGDTSSATPGTLAGMLPGDWGVICYGMYSNTGSVVTPPGGSWNTRVNVTDSFGFDNLVVVDKLNGNDRPVATIPSSVAGSWGVPSVAIAARAAGSFLPFFT